MTKQTYLTLLFLGIMFTSTTVQADLIDWLFCGGYDKQTLQDMVDHYTRDPDFERVSTESVIQLLLALDKLPEQTKIDLGLEQNRYEKKISRLHGSLFYGTSRKKSSAMQEFQALFQQLHTNGKLEDLFDALGTQDRWNNRCGRGTWFLVFAVATFRIIYGV